MCFRFTAGILSSKSAIRGWKAAPTEITPSLKLITLIHGSKAGYPLLSVISNLFFQKAAGNFVFRLPGTVVA
jgi:hypothetical protein